MTAASARRRSQIAALAADASWAATPNWSTRTAPGRAAWFRKFEDQVDPDRKLKPRERRKKAEKAMAVEMRLMSRKAVLAKRRKTCLRLLGSPVVLKFDGGIARGVLDLNDDVVLVLGDAGEKLASTPLDRVESIRAA